MNKAMCDIELELREQGIDPSRLMMLEDGTVIEVPPDSEEND